MSKSILLVGATGFVGGKILNLVDDDTVFTSVSKDLLENAR